MKEVVLEACYDPETGVSTVTKQNKYGIFTAHAKVSEHDLDVANRWDGIDFAEYKCDIKVEKARLKVLSERYNGALQLYNALFDVKDFGDDAYWKVYHQVCAAQDKMIESKERVAELKDGFDGFVEETLRTRRKLRARKFKSEQ